MKPNKLITVFGGLTERQSQVLLEILWFMKLHSRAPSYTEMRERLGVSSKQTIADFLLLLEEKGFLDISSREHRGIKPTPKALSYLVNTHKIESLFSKIDGKVYLVSILGEINSSSEESRESSNLWEFVPVNEKWVSDETIFQSAQFIPTARSDDLKLDSEEADFSTSKLSVQQQQQNKDNKNLPIEIYSSKASSSSFFSNNFLILSFNAKFDNLIDWLKKGVSKCL